MPDGQVLEFSGVSKRFGSVLAVDGFTARVEPGAVTGFLGPNGAGKTTSLRILLGLVRPTSGHATIGGVPYARLRHPLQTVGAALEASSFHPGRTAANHLKVYARAAGIPDRRVDEVLGTVGLADAGGRRVGGFSLGMRQRLGLAVTLLGDPGVLVLDEPANGLDPEGITWMRGMLRDLARQGRTVLVSSHLLSEVQQTVDRLLIIAHGRLVFQGGLDELTDPSEYTTVADAPDRKGLAAALREADIPAEVLRSGLVVRGIDPVRVGQAAADAGVALSLLQRRGPALEDVFFDLVNGLRVHASAQIAATTADAPVVPDAVVEAEPEPDAQPRVEAESEAAVETHTGPEVEAEAGPETVTEPEADAGAEDDADAEVGADADADARTEADAEAAPGVPAEVGAESEPETDVERESAPAAARDVQDGTAQTDARDQDEVSDSIEASPTDEASAPEDSAHDGGDR